MNPLSDFRSAGPAALDVFSWFNIVGEVGCVLWALAYLLIIRQCFRDKTYGVPLVGVCVNFAWETLASWVIPNPVPFWHVLDRVWFFTDAVIVWQLLRYGRAEQRLPELREHFYKVVAATFALSLVGQYTFVVQFTDRLGFIAAFVINLIMSILFIGMYLVRGSRSGVSVGAAWCKMLGTLATSIECHYLVRMVNPEMNGVPFLTYLSVSIFAVDCLYIYLVMRQAKAVANVVPISGMRAAA